MIIMMVMMMMMIGTLSNYDDDSSENITKKNEFASFQTLSRLFGTV